MYFVARSCANSTVSGYSLALQMRMRLLFTTIFFISLATRGFSQTKTLVLFKTSSKSDTSLYLTIKKGLEGIIFVFPFQEGQQYYTLKGDSTLEKHRFSDHQPIYGPYKFKSSKGKILFQDKNISHEYRDLYEISTKEHFSPDLYSSSTDSYNILNELVDPNALLLIGGTKVLCFKFFQTLSGHNSVLDKYYRIVYIDKANLLPCRSETYADKDCKKLEQVTFMKTYQVL